MVCLVEPLDEHLTRLEMQMRDVQGDVTRHQSRISVELAYVDKNFTDFEESLMDLSC